MKNSLKKLFHDKRIFPFLIAMLAFGMGKGFYSGVFNNYLFEVLHITRIERGIVEFPREFPGLILFLIVMVLARFSEIRMMGLSFFIGTIGLLGLGLFGNTRGAAIAFIVLWSTGEHMIMPIRQSAAMHMAKDGNEGLAMGMVASVRDVGKLVGQYLIPLIFFFLPGRMKEPGAFGSFRIMFFIAAGLLALALIVSMKIPDTHEHVKRKKLTLKKKFTKFYILEIFHGARKQVFITFAPYVLIMIYGARTELIATLYGLWSLGNVFLNPVIGRLIDKVGYRKIIIIDSLILIPLCFLYGFSHKLFPKEIAFIVVSAVFVIDAMLFVTSMARAKYVKSSSVSQEEVTSTLATGLSINHLVSIVIAILGGLLWEWLGVEVLFSVAGFFGLGAYIFALTIPERSPRDNAPVP